MSQLGQRTNQAEKRDFLWLDTASLGTVSKFSKAVKQSVLDFNVQSSLPWTKSELFLSDTRRTERATQRENWQKFAQFGCGYLQGQGQGGDTAALPFYSTHRISKSLKYMKIFHEDPMTILEYFKQINIIFEPVPSGIETTPTRFTSSNDTYNRGVYNDWATHPPGLGLVLEGLLGVLSGCLHIVHCMLHVILYPVYHLTLKKIWVRQSL